MHEKAPQVFLKMDSTTTTAGPPPPLPDFDKAHGFDVQILSEDGKVKKITKLADQELLKGNPTIPLEQNTMVYCFVTAFFKKTQRVFMDQRQERIEIVLGQSKQRNLF